MKHTPGPWVVDFDKMSIRPESNENGHIVGLPYYARTETADAQLIAAAPDLLEACDIALAFFDEGYDNEISDRANATRDDVVDMLHTALAKARGGQ